MFFGAICHRLTSISAVSKYGLKAWESINHLIENQFGADAVSNICSMNNNSQRKTENIDSDVNFASLDFLVPVKTLICVDVVLSDDLSCGSCVLDNSLTPVAKQYKASASDIRLDGMDEKDRRSSLDLL